MISEEFELEKYVPDKKVAWLDDKNEEEASCPPIGTAAHQARDMITDHN